MTANAIAGSDLPLAHAAPSARLRVYLQQCQARKSDTDYRVIGDPTEGALVCLAEKAGSARHAPAAAFESLRIDPQAHERRRETLSRKKNATIYVKGAPVETLAPMRPHPLGR